MIEKNKIKKRNQDEIKPSPNDTIIKYGGYFTIAALIFSGGFSTGKYISDLQSTENSIKNFGEFQKEREQMKDERDKLRETLILYKFSNPNYATKEDLDELKSNLEKFKKKFKNQE